MLPRELEDYDGLGCWVAVARIVCPWFWLWLFLSLIAHLCLPLVAIDEFISIPPFTEALPQSSLPSESLSICFGYVQGCGNITPRGAQSAVE